MLKEEGRWGEGGLKEGKENTLDTKRLPTYESGPNDCPQGTEDPWSRGLPISLVYTLKENNIFSKFSLMAKKKILNIIFFDRKKFFDTKILLIKRNNL